MDIIAQTQSQSKAKVRKVKLAYLLASFKGHCL